MKKSIASISLALVIGMMLGLALLLPAGIAADMVQDISAQINQNVTIMWDKAIFTATDSSGNIVQPIIYNNTVYVPLRAFGVESGHAVSWDPDTSTVSVSSPAEEEPASTEPPVESTYSTEFSEARSMTLDGENTRWLYWIRYDNVYMEYHDAVAFLRKCTGVQVSGLNYYPSSKMFVLNDKSLDLPYFIVDDYKLINISSIDRSYPAIEVQLDTQTGEAKSR